MSDNTFGTAHTDSQPPGGGGSLEHLPPGDLNIDVNVRDAATLDPQFVASIREHGVLQPVTAFRGPDGVVKVRYGQRRVLAAVQAGLASIPVYVRSEHERDEKA